MSEKFLNSDRISELWSAVKSALSGKQNTLTDGTGTTIQGSAVNVTTPVNGIVTQEEFDALPQAQQNKGMYVVTEDWDGSGGGSSGGQGDVYSTEEVRIGTWIDGKPLYRRVITGNLPESLNVSSGGQHMNIVVGYQVSGVMDTVVSLVGRIQHGSLKRWYSLPYTSVDSANAVAIHIMLSNGMNTSNEHKIYISYACTVAAILTQYTNDAYFIIVEYTKTTDEPEVTS